MRTYEGMFLLDSGQAVKDWEATVAGVTSVLERYGAELLLNGKWDERKLAYSIKKQKRGTYYLAYFTAPTDAIAKIRADLTLREEVLRFLILALSEDQSVPETLEVQRMVQDDDDDRRGGGGRRRRDDYGGSRRDGPRRDREESSGGGERPVAAASTRDGGES